MNKDSIIFFHPRNDYTGSTRVLANVIRDRYAHHKTIRIVTRNTTLGFLSDIDNVELISIPVLQHIPILRVILSEILIFFYALYFSFKHKTFYINTVIPFQVMIAGWLCRRDIICHIHEYIIIKNMRKMLGEWCVKHIPMRLLFVSKYVQSRYLIYEKSSYEVEYNKLSLEFLSKVEINPISQRKLNTILLISSLSELKGIFNYISLATRMPNYNFHMLISSDMLHINTFLASVEVPSNCIIHPATKDIHSFLYHTDLIVNMTIPSVCIETFGMTILEAMPYGIPAIAPNVGGPTELIQNGCNGFCVDVTDLNILQSKVEYILQKENYLNFSQNTLTMFKNKFA